MTGRLDGRRAFGTGGVRGIGAAIVRRSVAAGAQVVVTNAGAVLGFEPLHDGSAFVTGPGLYSDGGCTAT
jgi:2-hydroxycyclohexanecarboxyl-CoA dehydrogenase